MRGRSLLTHGEVVAALVANRLTAPAPLYDVAGWAGAAVAELLGVSAGLLNDDRLGRALEAVAPVAEDVRGRVLLASLERFDVDASRLHLDLTTVRVAGAYADSELVRKGWGADRRVARQARTLQAATPAGVAVYFGPHKGSEAELTALGAALATLQCLLPRAGGRGRPAFGHLGTLCAADGKGLRFVVPLRADTGWADRFDSDVRQPRRPRGARSPRRTRAPAAPATTHPLAGPSARVPGHRPRHRRPPRAAGRLHLVLRRSPLGRRRPTTRAHQGRRRSRSGTQRARRPLLQDPPPGPGQGVARILGPSVEALIQVHIGEDDRGKPTLTFRRNHQAIAAASRRQPGRTLVPCP